MPGEFSSLSEFLEEIVFPCKHQMFQPLLIALALAAILFIGYLFLRAYKPSWFGSSKKVSMAIVEKEEPFVASPLPPQVAKETNTPLPPIPAPAPVVKADPPMEPREVAPGGPNAPNARASPDREPTLSPEAQPIDPYDNQNMEAPIHDSMRHPELSFGPGVENTGMNQLGLSGVGGSRTMASESPFSPEFAQNGAGFMGSIFANDLKKGDNFAEF